MDPIPNERLRPRDIPADGARVHEIERFALTYNGYEHAGSIQACADLTSGVRQRYLAHGELPDDLGDLRACLFFEQRTWRWMHELPDDPETRRFVDALLAGIRGHVGG